MDKFSWTIFIKNLRDSPAAISLDYFEEALLALPQEDIEEVFNAISSRDVLTVDDGKQCIEMLQILWHYQ